MKDYSAMSDQQINTAVGLSFGEKVGEVVNGLQLVNIDAQYLCSSFNPCKNPADAWPIITANKISIIPRMDLWVAVKCSFVIDIDTPKLKSFIHANHSLDIPFCVNENPLKAAMIVYLQMMEQKS